MYINNHCSGARAFPYICAVRCHSTSQNTVGVPISSGTTAATPAGSVGQRLTRNTANQLFIHPLTHSLTHSPTHSPTHRNPIVLETHANPGIKKLLPERVPFDARSSLSLTYAPLQSPGTPWAAVGGGWKPWRGRPAEGGRVALEIKGFFSLDSKTHLLSSFEDPT